MAKRVRFDETVESSLGTVAENGNGVAEAESDDVTADSDAPSSSKAAKPDTEESKSKHTLDSDEEEEEKYERYAAAEHEEGQEEATIEFDANTRITPFNLREEEEEGHFTSDGAFVFDREKSRKKDEIRDAWLDGIDWAGVKKNAGERWEKLEGEGEDGGGLGGSDTESEDEEGDVCAVYEKLKPHLQSGESVLKAIRRLGKEDKSKMLEVTELVDGLISRGQMDAYDYTLEKLNFELKSHGRSEKAKPAKEVDIFGEEEPMDDSAQGGEATKEQDTEKAEEQVADDGAVRWMLRWTAEESADTYGPFSSKQMLDWQTDGYLKTGAIVKRSDQPDATDFYSASRIDFDLYLD